MSLSFSPGTVVAGRYRLDRLLGRGGMGQVWAATHEVTLRTVALKFLNTPVHLRPDRRRRFFREARAASAVRHPNVVQIHDFFELEDETPVMVMDLLEGETLGQRLAREQSLSLKDTATVFLPVVSAVGTAHAVGIVHRDLKPDNIFLARSADDRLDVRVLDFGIAKLTGMAGGDTDDLDALTRTGAMLGTPTYMSPEQSYGDKDVDHRTDIWSIGIMMYEALAGTRPIDGETMGRVLHRLMTEVITPIDVLMPELPSEMAALIDKMLTRDPAGRPKDLREVHALLSKYAEVVVPSFDAATEERPIIVDSGPGSAPLPSRAVIPLSGAADPDAATYASDPPIVSSRGAETDRTAVAPPSRRLSSKPWVVVAGAFALFSIGSLTTWFFSSRLGSAPDDSSNAHDSTKPVTVPAHGAPALPPIVTPSEPSRVLPDVQPSSDSSRNAALEPRIAPRHQRPREKPAASATALPSIAPSVPRETVPRDPSEAVVEEPPF